MTDLLPNVTAVKDRHGVIRYRFRKKGWPSRYVQGQPGTPEFLKSYNDCQNAEYVPQRRHRPPSRNIDPRLFVGGNWVYFIGANKGPIKIGTTVNLPARLKKLQTGSAMRLRVLACIEGTAELEAAYHARFADLRVNGEWFQGAPIRREIDRLRKQLLSNHYSGKFVQPKKGI
ncbi:MAG: hypothetical protein B7Y36_18670 [Novosphingobium sp. 28-62-57]|uniref:GIY-YIG nuclease family protein n=1 Tax=unclassified Novosphingobium TaxID=2644732 RepID=UPI000BCD53E0|nr:MULTISPECIES: GIY-YIG nuclease family protein [unclassified Novosphingobium]OYW50764.1 MAG: hypothetical protein B7Z34_02770 [Novosphingobium sp. 12-62-10]OYZ07893.1 MAG: hypothetical protein B7Y36_18670 [Novosphingobium sp. 28-62-57]